MRRCRTCSHPVYPTDRYCLACGRSLRRRSLDLLLVVGLTLSFAGLGGLVRADQGGSFGAAALASPATPTLPDATATAVPCRFVLGFQTLHDRLPAQVGDCLDDEHLDPASGDTVQHTTGGLLVWRKAGNGAAFTNGQTTWLLTASGIRRRPNDQRFQGEPNPDHLPLVPASG